MITSIIFFALIVLFTAFILLTGTHEPPPEKPPDVIFVPYFARVHDDWFVLVLAKEKSPAFRDCQYVQALSWLNRRVRTGALTLQEAEAVQRDIERFVVGPGLEKRA